MLNKKLQETYSLPVDYGALIVRDHIPHSVAVIPNSPADKAGIKENDIVLTLNGDKLTDEKDLKDWLQNCKVDEAVNLQVLRQKDTLELKVRLEERK